MWGNRKEEDLPAELKGKTPEQIVADLKKAEGLQSRLDALEVKNAERDTAFASFGSTQSELVNTLKAINERVTPAAPTRTAEPTEAASFITDPDLAFTQRIGPFAAVAMQTATITAKQEALRQFQRKQASEKNNIDATLFEKYEGEVLELAKNCTPQQLANPATWTHLYFNVKGRHADEIIANPKSFFTEDATRPVYNDRPSDENLTDQEKIICTKMGVTPENYLKNRKAASVMPF